MGGGNLAGRKMEMMNRHTPMQCLERLQKKSFGSASARRCKPISYDKAWHVGIASRFRHSRAVTDERRALPELALLWRAEECRRKLREARFEAHFHAWLVVEIKELRARVFMETAIATEVWVGVI